MIKVFEAFAGYGSQAMALKRAGIPHEVVGISEIDKYAIQAYNAVHGETKNYGDISKIDWSEVPDFDFFTYSFPCTDISNAGLQKGFAEGSGTRSGLLWECKKAIEAKRPKYLMMENVKALVSKKFMPDFLKWEEWLRQHGYTNFWQVLNAKDYGVPQNRERVFMISILGEAWYQFPEKIPLEKRLKDVLEEKVDEKYYLSSKAIERMTLAYSISQTGIVYVGDTNKGGQKGAILSADGICSALTATDYKQLKQIIDTDRTICLNSKVNGKQPSLQNRIYDVKGISTAVTTGFMRSIAVPTDKVIPLAKINASQDGIIVSPECIAPCHTSGHGNTPKIVEPIPFDDYNQRIPENKDIIGTVTPQFGNQAVRHGWKIIEPLNDQEGLCRTLKSQYQKNSLANFTRQGSRGATAVIEYTLRVPQATKQGYAEVSPGSVFDASYPESKTRRGRVQDGRQVSPTLTAGGEPPCYYDMAFRIRKLTPRECFRLMGVSDTDIDKIQAAGISNSQQYKMAGNSIVVDVLVALFNNLFFKPMIKDTLF